MWFTTYIWVSSRVREKRRMRDEGVEEDAVRRREKAEGRGRGCRKARRERGGV